MDLLTQILRPSWPTHARPPLLLLSESNRYGTHGTKSHQHPLSAWQVRFGLENSNLPPLDEVVECSVLSRIIGRVPNNPG
jgi:hypothetical protein